MNGLQRFHFHDPSQGNQKYNIIAHNPTKHQNTSKHWCQHIKPRATRNTRAYFPTSQSYLAIFYHQILLMPNKTHPAPGNQWWFLLNIAKSHSKTNYKLSFRVINCCQNSPGPTKTTTNCIIRYKCNTYRNQSRRKTNEVIFQIFDPTENIYSNLTRKFQVQ